MDSDEHVGEIFLRIDFGVYTARYEGLVYGQVYSGVVVSNE